MRDSIASSIAVATLLLAGCASQPTEACVETTEQEIEALFVRWNNSLQAGASQVVANYAVRSVLVPTLLNQLRLTPEEKEDYFDDFLKKKPFGTIDWRTIEIGCTTAVDVGLYTFTFASDPPAPPSESPVHLHLQVERKAVVDHESSLFRHAGERIA